MARSGGRLASTRLPNSALQAISIARELGKDNGKGPRLIGNGGYGEHAVVLQLADGFVRVGRAAGPMVSTLVATEMLKVALSFGLIGTV